MRRIKNIVTATALVVIVSGAGATTAQAQGIFSSSDFSGAGAYDYRLSSALHPSSNTDSGRANGSGTATRGARPRTGRGVVRAANASTTFRPVGGTIVPQQWAAELNRPQQDRQELEQFFVKCLNLYEEKARSNGGEVHDVARATAYFIEVNYITSKGAPLSDAQFNSLRQAVRTGLLNDPNFQGMSGREKQKMYERMAILGSYVMIGYNNAETKGDAKEKQEFRVLAKENFEKLLGPIDKVSFTNNGIEFK